MNAYRVRFAGLLAVVSLCLSATASRAQPTPNYNWNVFSGTANWSTGSWLPGGPPISAIDTILSFSSDPTQRVASYTSVFDMGAFDLNALLFSNQGTAITLQGNATGDTLRFNTSSTGTLPAIWQTNTGLVTIANGAATNGITLNNSTNLRILGNGVGSLYLDANIVETGGSSSITINQTGNRSFNTGSMVRLSGFNTFTGGVNLTAGNLLITNNSSLGTGTLTVNTAPGAGSLQFSDKNVGFSALIDNHIQLNQTLVITGNISTLIPYPIANFRGPITGPGGITIANTVNQENYLFTNGGNTFTGPLTAAPVAGASTIITFQDAGTASGVTTFNISYNTRLWLIDTTPGVTRLNTVTPPTLNLNTSIVDLSNYPSTSNATESFGPLFVSGNGTLSVGSSTQTGYTTNLKFNSLTRVLNGTLDYMGANLGSNAGYGGYSTVTFANNPGGAIGGGGAADTVNQNILPYAFAHYQIGNSAVTVTVNSFIRWDPVSQQLMPLPKDTAYNGSYFLPLINATDNVRFSNDIWGARYNSSSLAGMNSAATFNSLILDTLTNTPKPLSIGVSLSGTGTLTVTSGAIASVNTTTNSYSTVLNPSMINLGGLNFGSNTGYIFTYYQSPSDSTTSLIINSPISGSAGLVKYGDGVMELNATNPFTGGLTINKGFVKFSTDANLGANNETLTLNGGRSGGLKFVPSPLFGPEMLNSTTVARPVLVGAGGSNISVPIANNNLILSGNISGSGPLIKTGYGVLTLTGNNTFTGTLAIDLGTVNVSSDSALGATSSGLIINPFSTLQTSASFTMSRDILMINVGTIFNPFAGTTLTMNGNLTSKNSSPKLYKDGPGDIVFTGMNTYAGTYLNGDPTPTVHGTMTASTSNLGRTIFSGVNGSMPLASGFSTINNGEIVLDNTSAINTNRIGMASVNIAGGGFRLIGNSSSPVNESIGAVTFNDSNNPYGGNITLVTPAGSGQSTSLTAQSLSPNATVGTVFIRGLGLGATTGDRTAFNFTTNPVLFGGLVPSLVGASSVTSDPTDFLTTRANGAFFSIVPFTAYTAGTGSLGAGNSGSTYDVTGAASFSGTSAANALRISGGSLDLGGGTMTVGSGAILSTGGSNGGINNGNLAFGSAVARFTVASGSDLTVSGGITGTGGFVKAGSGKLTLNSAASITGAIGVGQGTLSYGIDNALPISTNLYINGGASLDLNGHNATFALINGYGNVNIGSGGLTISSTIYQVITYGGSLTGTGSLTKTGTTNTFTITGDSSGFSGNVNILGGTLVANGNTSLGTGTISIGGTSGSNQAILSINSTVSNLANNIVVPAGSTPTAPHSIYFISEKGSAIGGSTLVSGNIDIQNNSLSYTSNGYTQTGVGLRLSSAVGYSSPTTTMNGTISGPGALVVSGNFLFNGHNTYSGGTFIDSYQQAAAAFSTDTVTSNGNIVSGPFGTGPIAFSKYNCGSNLRAIGGARTLGNAIILIDGSYFGVSGSNPLTLTGNIDLQASGTTQEFNITNTAMTTISGVISNSTLGINKNGPGTLNLTASNTYTGSTYVNAGTLLVNNTTGVGAHSVDVDRGAIVGGTGSIGSSLYLFGEGTVKPGNNGPGILTVNGNTQVSANGILNIIINGNTVGTQYSQLKTTGTLNVTDSHLVLEIGNFTPNINDKYFIALNGSGSAVTGTFLGLPEGSTVISGNFSATLSYLGNAQLDTITGGHDIVLFNPSPVPEPSTILLASAGAISLLGWARRRKHEMSKSVQKPT